MFPSDSTTISHELVGVSSYTFFSGNYIILGASIQQSGNASYSQIRCDSDIFLKNYAQVLPYNSLYKTCNGSLIAEKTNSGDSAFITLTYRPNTPDPVSISTATISAQLNTLPNLYVYSFVFLLFVLGFLMALKIFKK